MNEDDQKKISKALRQCGSLADAEADIMNFAFKSLVFHVLNAERAHPRFCGKISKVEIRDMDDVCTLYDKLLYVTGENDNNDTFARCTLEDLLTEELLEAKICAVNNDIAGFRREILDAAALLIRAYSRAQQMLDSIKFKTNTEDTRYYVFSKKRQRTHLTDYDAIDKMLNDKEEMEKWLKQN